MESVHLMISDFIFCNKCGGQNEKESEFCSTCGEKITHFESLSKNEDQALETISEQKDGSPYSKSDASSIRGLILVGSIATIPISILSAYNFLFPQYICLAVNVVIIALAIYNYRKTKENPKKQIPLLVFSIISMLVTLAFAIVTIVLGGELNFV